MSGSVNKVIVLGNLGKDPEIRSFQNGGRVAAFSVATSERWKDKTSGEPKERTEWHRVSVLNDALIGVVEKYLKKGSKVYIEGQLETRKYTDKDGVERYSTDVVVRPYRGEITLLDSKADSALTTNQAQEPSFGAVTTYSGGVPELDDSIPFSFVLFVPLILASLIGILS